MTQSIVSGAWAEALAAAGASLGDPVVPPERERPWLPLIAQYGARGFLASFVRSDGDRLALLAEASLAPDLLSRAASELDAEPSISEGAHGARRLELRLGEPARAGALLALLKRLAVTAARGDDSDRDEPTEEQDEAPKKSAFEAIGDEAPRGEGAPRERERAPTRSAFEAIGEPDERTSSEDRSDRRAGAPAAIALDGPRASVRDGVVRLTFRADPAGAPAPAALEQLGTQLERRYDAVSRGAQLVDGAWTLAFEPGNPRSANLHELASELRDGAERARRLRALDDHEAAPREREPPAGAQTGGEVIFAELSGTRDDDGATVTLHPGNFEALSLREPDSEAQLVDLILRHPSYADDRMARVLSILLSVPYRSAARTIARAPCPIAWGLGRDKALEMKRVIENAGGRALLAEPGRFRSSARS